MNKTLNLVIIVAVLIGVILVAYVVASFVALRKAEVTNEARFQCSQSSRYQINDPTASGSATVWYPVKDMYEKCLKEKGI